MTVADLIDLVRTTCVDVMHVLPGMSYEHLLEMTWQELLAWQNRAVSLLKAVRGINE